MSVTASETPQSPPALNEAAAHEMVEIINLLASARDAMSDGMVSRLARAISEGVALLDRLTSNHGFMRLLQVLDQPESQRLLIGLAEALRAASRDIAATAPCQGGLWETMHGLRQPATQEGIRILAYLGRHLSDSLREQHRRGG